MINIRDYKTQGLLLANLQKDLAAALGLERNDPDYGTDKLFVNRHLRRHIHFEAICSNSRMSAAEAQRLYKDLPQMIRSTGRVYPDVHYLTHTLPDAFNVRGVWTPKHLK